MALTATVPACDLVIFGTKGDLARRKLLPSLYQLEKAGNIHPETRIIGAGRADWSVQYLPQRATGSGALGTIQCPSAVL